MTLGGLLRSPPSPCPRARPQFFPLYQELLCPPPGPSQGVSPRLQAPDFESAAQTLSSLQRPSPTYPRASPSLNTTLTCSPTQGPGPFHTCPGRSLTKPSVLTESPTSKALSRSHLATNVPKSFYGRFFNKETKLGEKGNSILKYTKEILVTSVCVFGDGNTAGAPPQRPGKGQAPPSGRRRAPSRAHSNTTFTSRFSRKRQELRYFPQVW